MQRMSLFLGYPIYSLTVVLFTLLLASSPGSYWAEHHLARRTFSLPALALGLLGGLVAVHFATESALLHLCGAATGVRIGVAFAVTAVVGIPMGMLYSLGVRMSTPHQVSLPWGWALNGATSAAGAVYAIALSLSYGITLTYALSLVVYSLALLVAWHYRDQP
jgi:hypothetical protein